MVNDCHSLVTRTHVRNQALTYTLECKCEVGGARRGRVGLLWLRKARRAKAYILHVSGMKCVQELYNCPRRSLGTETLQSILKFDALKD